MHNPFSFGLHWEGRIFLLLGFFSLPTSWQSSYSFSVTGIVRASVTRHGQNQLYWCRFLFMLACSITESVLRQCC